MRTNATNCTGEDFDKIQKFSHQVKAKSNM